MSVRSFGETRPSTSTPDDRYPTEPVIVDRQFPKLSEIPLFMAQSLFMTQGFNRIEVRRFSGRIDAKQDADS